MRVLMFADAKVETTVTNTTELLFGKPLWEWLRDMMRSNAGQRSPVRAERLKSWSTTAGGR